MKNTVKWICFIGMLTLFCSCENKKDDLKVLLEWDRQVEIYRNALANKNQPEIKRMETLLLDMQKSQVQQLFDASFTRLERVPESQTPDEDYIKDAVIEEIDLKGESFFQGSLICAYNPVRYVVETGVPVVMPGSDLQRVENSSNFDISVTSLSKEKVVIRIASILFPQVYYFEFMAKDNKWVFEKCCRHGKEALF